MNNNIIYDNDKENNILQRKSLNQKEKIESNKDSKNDDIYLYSDKEEESFDLNNNNKDNMNEELPLNYRDKNGGDSVVNYKLSISNKNQTNIKNKKSEKKSTKKNIDNIKNMNNLNFNKNQSKRTSKISEFYDYFNQGNNLNNNLFSSFSSCSSVKINNNNIKNKNEIDLNDNDTNNNMENNIIDNNNFLNIIKNNISDNKNGNKKHEKINDENKVEINKNKILKNENLINNNNFLDLINNKENIKKENNKIINNNNKKFEENNNTNNIRFKKNINIPSKKEGFDFEKCLNIIDKEKWVEKQEQIQLLKIELNSNLSKDNYNNSKIPMESIINLINKKLNDNQQKLVILMLELLEIIITKLNEIFNDEYLPVLSKSIINNLNDNNIQLRYKAATVILKILSFNKKEFFISELIESLRIDKNNMRIEILTILTQYFSNSISSSSKKTKKIFFELLIEPLVLCLEDKFNKIRNLTEDLIKESINFISIDNYYEATKHLYNKVVQDKVNSKIREIYGLGNKEDLKKSNVSIKSIIDNENNLSKNKKNKERSKSTDLSNNNKYIKKNVNKNTSDNNKKIFNKNIIRNPNNKINEVKEIDYKNVFKKNQNFVELKKFRNNKDMKLNKNFLTIKEKSNILINNLYINSNNSDDLKPLFPIFNNDFISQCIIPSNNDLNQIISHINKIITNISEKNFKSELLPNLDIILEFIIRLFEKNLIEKKFDFVNKYISFINNLYEKLETQNLKLTQLEYNLILQSLIYLAKYNKKSAFNSIQNFYKLLSVDRTFRILFDYNDLKDIETQKNIIELFKMELNQGNINIMNDNFLLAKKMIKLFNKEETVEIGKDFFKYIYDKYGSKIFNAFISSLNKQDKNILLTNIDFFILKDKTKESKKQNNFNITEFKIDLSNMNESENKNNNNNNIVTNNIKLKKLINKDNNTIIEKPKIIEEKREINNIKELIELLKELNSNSEEFDLDLYNKENDINNNNILSNKSKLISELKELFSELSYPKKKAILIKCIELILDSLSKEINYFFNINTMIENCANNIIEYTREILSIFLIISSKQEIIAILKGDIINKLIILFLNYLEIDKEEGISDINDIFKEMLQKINKITLNIIQKGKRELIIIILIKLISTFKEESDMSLLAINCLVNLIKITNFKKYNTVEILTEIIIAVDDEELFLKNNNKINELFLKSIKKLLNQMVIEKKYNILKDYQLAINSCNIQDEKVSDWIQKILEHNKF